VTTQTRFDRAGFRGATRTPQGFLKLDGFLTRVGVLTYRNDDGTPRREFRPPEEVFHVDSLASLAHAPVTDLHPSELVTPANVRDLQRGFVSSEPSRSDSFVRASVIVQDGDLIAKIESGSRRELSCGYTCTVDPTPGEWQGQRYDCVQRTVRYNHVGIGPRGWGRAGADVALHLDGAALADFVDQKLALMNKTDADMAQSIGVDVWALRSFLCGYWDTFKSAGESMTGLARKSDLSGIASYLNQDAQLLFDLVPTAERGDGEAKTPPRKIMDTIVIKLDGTDCEVPKASAPFIEKAFQASAAKVSDLSTKLDQASAKADAQAARADGAAKEAADLKVKLDAAESPERVTKLVAERVSFERNVSAVVGEAVKFDGKSEGDLMIECIKHVDSSFDAAGKSADYLRARFDMVVAAAEESKKRQDSKGDAAKAVLDARFKGRPTVDGDASRAKMIEESRKLSSGPLTMSK
jgi:hypothetical protein